LKTQCNKIHNTSKEKQRQKEIEMEKEVRKTILRAERRATEEEMRKGKGKGGR